MQDAAAFSFTKEFTQFLFSCCAASCPCLVRLSSTAFGRAVISEKCLHYRRPETGRRMV